MTTATTLRNRSLLLGEDVRLFWSLAWTLAVTDWKLRFYGSALGYLWTLARPFAFFGVIYLVFTEVAKIGNDVKDYGICILFSMVLFQFFGEATNGSVTAVVRRENLLRKMRFPHLAIPLSTVLTAMMNLVATLAAVFVFAIASGVYPNWGWLELPVLIALLAVVATGTGLMLSVLFVRYRDVQPIWEVALQLLFWGTPIIYTIPIADVAQGINKLIMMNPLAVLIQQGRHWLVPNSTVSASQAIGEPVLLLVPLAIFVGVAALSIWTFRRAEGRLAEEL
jgi:ABC-2 type transport system permease protein